MYISQLLPPRESRNKEYILLTGTNASEKTRTVKKMPAIDELIADAGDWGKLAPPDDCHDITPVELHAIVLGFCFPKFPNSH